MNAVKKEEISNHFKQETFKVMLEEEVRAASKVLPGRFVLSIKSSKNGLIK